MNYDVPAYHHLPMLIHQHLAMHPKMGSSQRGGPSMHAAWVPGVYAAGLGQVGWAMTPERHLGRLPGRMGTRGVEMRPRQEGHRPALSSTREKTGMVGEGKGPVTRSLTGQIKIWVSILRRWDLEKVFKQECDVVRLVSKKRSLWLKGDPAEEWRMEDYMGAGGMFQVRGEVA